MEEKSGTGKKKYGIIAVCAVAVLAAVIGAYWLGRSAGGGADIGEEAAKLAALGHAQVSEADLTRYGISRDERAGKHVYEVEFTADGVEYDYEVSAADGSIVSFQKKQDGAAALPPGITVENPADGDIGGTRALEIAMEHAGVPAEGVTASPAKRDYEDGVLVYELEFYSGGYEYDYEIRASDGAVLKSERDVDGRAPAAQTSAVQIPSADTEPAYIGEARAREIVYAWAGVAAGDVARCDVELDHHDEGHHSGHGGHHAAGCCRYEIDFHCGGYEYDCEVDAVTGEILRSQREVDS